MTSRGDWLNGIYFYLAFFSSKLKSKFVAVVRQAHHDNYFILDLLSLRPLRLCGLRILLE
jgi:hypothetical protein